MCKEDLLPSLRIGFLSPTIPHLWLEAGQGVSPRPGKANVEHHGWNPEATLKRGLFNQNEEGRWGVDSTKDRLVLAVVSAPESIGSV